MTSPGLMMLLMMVLVPLEDLAVSLAKENSHKMIPQAGTGRETSPEKTCLNRILALLLDQVNPVDQIHCLAKLGLGSTLMLQVGTGQEMGRERTSHRLKLLQAQSHSIQEDLARCQDRGKNHLSLKVDGTGPELNRLMMYQNLVLILFVASHNILEDPARCHEKDRNHLSLKADGIGQEDSLEMTSRNLVLTL